MYPTLYLITYLFSLVLVSNFANFEEVVVIIKRNLLPTLPLTLLLNGRYDFS